MARSGKILEGIEHNRAGYNAGCDCDVCRTANSRYLKAYRERKRAEKLAAAGVELPAAEPAPAEPSPEDPHVIGPIEQALAEDLKRDGSKPRFLEAVGLVIARSLDGAVRSHRHDLVSPLVSHVVAIGERLFPPAPVDGGGDDATKRGQLLELIQGDGDGGKAADGA